MKKILFFLLVVAGFSLSAQTKVSGISIPEKAVFSNQTLSLNGAGVREKFWMDMYVGALYLDEKSSDADAILNSDKPMAIKLHIVSKLINSKRMLDAVDEGFENATHENTAPLSSEIEKFKSFFSDEINKDDVFDILYLPATGVTVFKNGQEKGSISGMDFKKALFGIWLSDSPADKDLKESMLGK